MSNTLEVQREIALKLCRQRLAEGASLQVVLGMAWEAGYIEADRDTPAPAQPSRWVDDAEFDRRVDELNAELESIDRFDAGNQDACPIHCVRPCCNPRNREP